MCKENMSFELGSPGFRKANFVDLEQFNCSFQENMGDILYLSSILKVLMWVWWRIPLVSALESEVGGSLSSRPAWSTRLYRETLS